MQENLYVVPKTKSLHTRATIKQMSIKRNEALSMFHIRWPVNSRELLQVFQLSMPCEKDVDSPCSKRCEDESISLRRGCQSMHTGNSLKTPSMATHWFMLHQDSALFTAVLIQLPLWSSLFTKMVETH